MPKDLIDKVLNWTPRKGGGISRPKFLIPYYNYKEIIDNLIKIAPTKLEIVGGSNEYPTK